MDTAVRRWDAPVVMHPTSFSCARCGMASPTDDARCRACGAKRFVASSPAGSARTGPAAAEAWAATRWRGSGGPHPDAAAAAGAEAARGGGPAGGSRPPAHPVGSWAVAAWRSLHVVVLVGVAVAAVQAVRLVLVAVADDQAVLLAERWWEPLDTAAGLLGAVLVASAAVGALLVAVWGVAAGRNLVRLSIEAGTFTRSSERVAGRGALLVAAVAAWRWAPTGPERLDRCLDLGFAALAGIAAVALAGAVQRLLVVVTTAELERAEWLLRLEAATVPRPKGRSTELAG